MNHRRNASARTSLKRVRGRAGARRSIISRRGAITSESVTIKTAAFKSASVIRADVSSGRNSRAGSFARSVALARNIRDIDGLARALFAFSIHAGDGYEEIGAYRGLLRGSALTLYK